MVGAGGESIGLRGEGAFDNGVLGSLGRCSIEWLHGRVGVGLFQSGYM